MKGNGKLLYTLNIASVEYQCQYEISNNKTKR